MERKLFTSTLHRHTQVVDPINGRKVGARHKAPVSTVTILASTEEMADRIHLEYLDGQIKIKKFQYQENKLIILIERW
jgi:hypothetical protein